VVERKCWKLESDSCASGYGRALPNTHVDAGSPDGPPAIQALDARFVEGTAFPLLKWYYASGAWFYHKPATFHRLQAGDQFFELVDPCLKPLCRLAIDAGLCTTPSCQGHFFPREHFSAIWHKLTAELAQVRAGGLLVRDCEDQREYLWLDPAFESPWSDFEAFYEQVHLAQTHGFLGIAIPTDRTRLIDWLRARPLEAGAARACLDATLSGTLGQPVLCATVTPQSPPERDAAWSAITEHLVKALESECVIETPSGS
jgi:hypothetical protein